MTPNGYDLSGEWTRTLRDPRLRPRVHNALVVYVRDQLQPCLPRSYVAALEERVFVEETAR